MVSHGLFQITIEWFRTVRESEWMDGMGWAVITITMSAKNKNSSHLYLCSAGDVFFADLTKIPLWSILSLKSLFFERVFSKVSFLKVGRRLTNSWTQTFFTLSKALRVKLSSQI